MTALTLYDPAWDDLEIPLEMDRRSPDDRARADAAKSHRAVNSVPRETVLTSVAIIEPPAAELFGRSPAIDDTTREHYANRIVSAYRRSVEQVIETGRLLIEAKAALPHGTFIEMCKVDLPFGEDTAERLIKIARNPWLADSAHARNLPSSWYTLSELAKLDIETLDTALTAGRIRPDMERKDAEKLNAARQRRLAGVATDPANRSDDDFYPTPREAVDKLLRVEAFSGTIWEPACGDGAISKILIEHGYHVISSDKVDRGYGTGGLDFLAKDPEFEPAEFAGEFHWNIVTNPPFSDLFDKFLARAIERVEGGKVALLGRLQVLEGKQRGEFFKAHPPSRVWVFSERLPFKRPGWVDTGNGSMMAYLWLVWDPEHAGPPSLGWL